MLPERLIYCGAAPSPAELAARWNLDPYLLLVLGAIAVIHFLGPRRDERYTKDDLCFCGGWLVLVVAFVSPLCAASSALFSARALHHLLLVAVAAPLLIQGGIGRHVAALMDVMRLRMRPTLASAVALHFVTFWLWHAPPAYDAALSDPAVYWLMQTTLLGSALLLWSRLLDPASAPVPTMLALVGTVAQMGMLGALIALAPAPLYAPHLTTTLPWGLTPLQDQQLAGLIMWVPGAIPYAVLGIALMRRWSRMWTVAQEHAP